MPGITFLESEDGIANLVKGSKTLVHYKGFGPFMDMHAYPPPEEMLRTLSASDVLVFDGDDYSDNSFTFAIPKALELAEKEKRPHPILLAFKFKHDRDQFEKSWSRAVLPATFRDSIYCYLVKAEDIVVPKFYNPGQVANLPGAPCSLNQDQEQYVALGTYAVHVTGQALGSSGAPLARRVIVWGGLYIVLRELQVNVALWGAETPPWTYYHASRTRPSPSGPTVQEGVLAEVDHPILTQR